MRFAFLLFPILAALCVAGCDVVVGSRWIDPKVVPFEVQTEIIDGEPTVELGFYIEQLYAPLADGDDCPVVWGLQGGTWTMPALRIKGIAPRARVTCSIVTQQSAETVSLVEADVVFYLASDGWYETQAMPLPIVHAEPHEADPIDDLCDQDGTLDCSVVDEERGATMTVEVHLVEG